GSKKKAVDKSIFATCASDSFKWEFTVSNKLDLTPPQITGVFPAPDDSTDTIEQSSFLAAASGGIGVINQGPQNYKEATITDPVPGTGSPEIDSSMIEDYHGQDKIFRVVIDASDLKAKLYRGFTLLGSADFFNKKITFPHYFSFTLKTDPSSGNSWDITVDPERLASTLTVGQTVYTFSDNNNGNNILIGGTPEETAANISDKLNGSTILNGNSEVKSLKSTPDWKFAVEARVAGAAGNNIVLDTNTPYSISVPQNAKLSGGSDGNSEVKIIGKKDQPRNSVIQINFDEPINPMTISGSATDLKEYLQVYNKEAGQDKVDGHACTGNNECLSFKCNADKCVGDFLAGKFVPASNYKTVEFISDNECGMNGCGEKIYCLPANSNIGVMVNAADLFKCTDDKKCSGFGSYKCLDDNLLSHKTCQTNIKDTRRNYPLFDINSSKKGLTDLANNSLDGNGDGYADGPGPKPFLANDPKSPDSIGDNYFWSFWINNQLLINSPKILSLVPNQGASTTATPFNILMMASTIKTGSEVKVVDFGNGPESVTHKFLNVWSQTPQPLGYWAESNNKDAAVNGLLLDGWPDLTDIYIKHSNFGESITYNAQAGSGLKDIYQNCFKPSSGPGLNGVDCNASDGDPSCCFGVATSSISTTSGKKF
ncbi:MAG: hypothetical protein NTX66_03950, partial [Candidatus Falkowbacteria bacterium]|nr:hypothetical protein [Candidatus Falkowbacteria bacterium]